MIFRDFLAKWVSLWLRLLVFHSDVDCGVVVDGSITFQPSSATAHTTFNNFLRQQPALKRPRKTFSLYLQLASSPTSSWPICISRTRDTSRSKFSDSHCLCSVAYIWRAKRNPIIFIAIFQCFWGLQKRKSCEDSSEVAWGVCHPHNGTSKTTLWGWRSTYIIASYSHSLTYEHQLWCCNYTIKSHPNGNHIVRRRLHWQKPPRDHVPLYQYILLDYISLRSCWSSTRNADTKNWSIKRHSGEMARKRTKDLLIN